jgi:AcrR family transcriptional regulator
MDDAATVNFRTRTGQMRRARTRAKILSTAFALFDERSVDQVTVEDVRASAGLARGSFYNYFLTYEYMLKEMAAEISRQINIEQTERFDAMGNLVERMWCNARYFVLRAASDRSCSEILIRVTPLLGPLNEHMRRAAERNIRQSVKRKLINVPSAGVALDLGYGLAAVMIRRALQSGIDAKEVDAAGLLLLRAFGLKDIPLRAAVIAGFGAA